MRRLVVLLMICAVASAQDKARPIVDSGGRRVLVSICDLIHEPFRYNDTVVAVHADVLDGMGHGTLLTHTGCDNGLKMLASERIRQGSEYKNFEQVFYSQRRTVSDGRMSATFEGRFLYRPAEPRLKWALEVQRITDVVPSRLP